MRCRAWMAAAAAIWGIMAAAATDSGSMTVQLQPQNMVSGLGEEVDGELEPGHEIRVIYGPGSRVVQPGERLTREGTAAAPRVEVVQGPTARLFTIVMVDPDAPDPANPVNAEWLHWLLVDVPANTVVDGGMADKEAMPYAGPTPPISVHRYVFLVYRQAQGVPTCMPPEERAALQEHGRRQFSHERFAKAHGLGAPVAATYFTVASYGS